MKDERRSKLMSISKKIDLYNSYKEYLEAGLLDDPKTIDLTNEITRDWVYGRQIGLKPELEYAAENCLDTKLLLSIKS